MKRSMTLATMLGLTLLLMLFTDVPTRAQILASSTFNAGRDNWTTHEDILGNSFKYVSSGGCPSDGYITATDDNSGGSWWYQAPQKFYDNSSGAYGGHLDFSLRTHKLPDSSCDDPSYYVDPAGGDVILQSEDGYTLWYYFTTTKPELETCKNFTVPLNESSWTNTKTGRRPSKFLFKHVLKKLSKLYIRGEYYECIDSSDLDSVYLYGPSPVRKPMNSSRRMRSRLSK